jgi:hypothetical protein
LSRTHVIVWDLDGTLGEFTAVHEQGEAPGAVTVRVRPGLPEALHRLAEAGFAHTVLTLATPLYAEVVLRATGLRQHFFRVEGLGQRGKGDAEGVGDSLGIPEDQRPHRMIFVGDHPLFDEPQDQRVVFHLEPCGLVRPADQLARLVLHLRDAGGGSLARGFDRLGRAGGWWRRFGPFRPPLTKEPLRRAVPGVGDVLLARRSGGPPVIGFADFPEPPGDPVEHSFAPAEFVALVEAEQGKG